ncbi:MAG: 50S ribosomal protein L18Ae [Candidatus ainarchaeum sp.]|nr:50S ribosomal protein L18Ae [Candidatus ainarchaeum sp.]
MEWRKIGMKFTVSGKILLGSEERTFVKEIEAASENAARHKAYGLFGSQNGLQRNRVRIEKIVKA